MLEALWKKVGVSRRDLFRDGGLLAALQSLNGGRQAEAASLELGPNLYRSIGVRPLINARGTFTIITGSQTLPEVKQAMDLASRSFVHMDELMDGVSKRLAELTGAEWGIVTAGCCAAIAHFAASCIAGGNPERMQRLPDLTGLKSECIVPAYSHNVYDHAVRMLGLKLVIVNNPPELEAAFSERTALVYILGGPGDDGPLGTRAVAQAARRRNVPVLVDAAAEVLTVKPNVHLERGAHAVAYSGGKCMRGPQAAGLLLGDKSLLQGAWINSAPHHAFGRSLKAGKEEIMGMLAAVEMWVRRDHKAEWAEWERRLEHIAMSVKRVDGVTTKVNQPSADLSNRTPELIIQWDGAKLGITGQEIGKIVLDSDPRIVVARSTGTRSGNMASTIGIVPYQMMPGDEKVVAERLYALLSKPPKIDAPPAPPSGDPLRIAGNWDLHMDFVHGSVDHVLTLEQDGAKLKGTHQGEFASGDVNGSVAGNTVRFQTTLPTVGTRVSFQFSGVADSGQMHARLHWASTAKRSGARTSVRNGGDMKKTNRRSFLGRGVAAAATVSAAAGPADAQGEKPVKRVIYKDGKKPAKTPLFNSTVAYGNLLFIAGVGAHFEGDIKAHTKSVLDSIKDQLESAGSSMEKVLKCNVYLNDLKDWPAMNEVFQGRFGPEPPVRTTIAAPGGIPGNSLVEIDVIAYI